MTTAMLQRKGCQFFTINVRSALFRNSCILNRGLNGNRLSCKHFSFRHKPGLKRFGRLPKFSRFLDIPNDKNGLRFSTTGKQDDPAPAEDLKMNKILTVPNVLTLSRIFVTPGLCWLILDENFKYACIGLALMGFSDYLDGVLARSLKQQTVFGSIMDPIADKVLITALAITEGYSGLMPFPLACLIVGRDVLLV